MRALRGVDPIITSHLADRLRDPVTRQPWRKYLQKVSRIAELLATCRCELDRVAPCDLAAEIAAGALVVDTRSLEQRERDGELPDAVTIDRNVLEWRLDPTSASRIPQATRADLRVIVVCNEGYSSSLAAYTLRQIGLHRATDLVDGYQGWLRDIAPNRAPRRLRGHPGGEPVPPGA